MTQAILDTHEFDRLYSEYKSRFIVIAYALLRDKTLAEDLVTDSFLLLWEKRQEIQLSQNEFPAYILGIVRHKCIDALRERQTHLQIQHQMYLRGMRNIRTSLGLLEDCDLSKVLFHKDVEEIFRRRLAEMPELSAQISNLSADCRALRHIGTQGHTRNPAMPASATRRLGRLPASGDAAIPEPAQQTVEKRKGRPNRDCDCDRG